MSRITAILRMPYAQLILRMGVPQKSPSEEILNTPLSSMRGVLQVCWTQDHGEEAWRTRQVIAAPVFRISPAFFAPLIFGFLFQLLCLRCIDTHIVIRPHNPHWGAWHKLF